MHKRKLLPILLSMGLISTVAMTSARGADVAALPLDDMHDVGYILQLIRQQAVDIYAESTQRKDDKSGSLAPLTTIPHQALADQSEYKPLRKAWIVFFIGTMEPLLGLLQEAFREVKSGEVILKVPQKKSAELIALESQVGECLASMNNHLNKCAAVLDSDEVGNVIVAQEAEGIAADASKAEEIRQKTVKAFGNLGAPGTYEMHSDK
jgi:hypothetical protein